MPRATRIEFLASNHLMDSVHQELIPPRSAVLHFTTSCLAVLRYVQSGEQIVCKIAQAEEQLYLDYVCRALRAADCVGHEKLYIEPAISILSDLCHMIDLVLRNTNRFSG